MKGGVDNRFLLSGNRIGLYFLCVLDKVDNRKKGSRPTAFFHLIAVALPLHHLLYSNLSLYK